MTVYVVYTFAWLAVALAWLLGIRSRWPAGLLLMYGASLIVLRGSGTDTAWYDEWAELVINAPAYDELTRKGVEPLFVALVQGLAGFSNDGIVVIRLVGLLYVLIWVGFLVRAQQAELRWFVLVYQSGTFLAFGMNGVRQGLAFAVLALVAQAVRRRQYAAAALAYAGSALTHYAAAAGALVLASGAFRDRSLSRGLIWLSAGAAITALAFAGYAAEWLRWKYELYAAMPATSPFGGAAVTCASLLVAYAITTDAGRQARRIAVGLALAAIIVQGFAYATYAAVRLAWLLLQLCLLLYGVTAANRSNRPRGRVDIALFAAGVFLAASFVSNVLEDFGGQVTRSPTPFAPYKFAWE